MLRKGFMDALQRKTLTPRKTEKITNHLMIDRTELYRADLGLIFGSYAFCDELVTKAATLYYQGYFGKILIMGGVTNKQGITESHYIKARLDTFGISTKNILVEDISTNTQENIEQGKIVVDREIGLENIQKTIGIGQLYAARRYMMTMKRRWPDVFNMHASVNGFDCPREKWPEHSRFRKHVLSEWKKQTTYKKKDFIREINVEEINRTVRQWREKGINSDKPTIP